MLHMNAQGLLSHLVEIRKLLHDVQPEILCISETHVTSEIGDSELHIPGYIVTLCYSNSTHTGGTTIYIKEHLKFTTLKQVYIDYNYWSTWIKIDLGFESIIVGAIYRSPNGNCRDFFKFLEEELDADSSQKNRTFILGDLNIDFLKNDGNALHLKRIVQDSGFKQIVANPTRITNVSLSLIDHIITNEFACCEVERVYPVISDHEIIGTELTLNEKLTKDTNTFRRKLNEEAIANLTQELVGASWNFTSTDVNVLYADFMSIILAAVDKIAPIKKISIRKYPWITDKVCEVQKDRDRAYKKFAITKDNRDWVAYKNLRNKVTNTIRTEKRKHYNDRVDRCKDDSKKMWRTLKELLGSKKPATETSHVQFNSIRPPEENFNNFYCDSIREVSESIEKRNWNYMFVSQQTEFSMFTPLNLSELRSVVNELKSKSTSDDYFTVNMLKKLFCVIGFALLYLVNTSLSSGCVPNELKVSLIVPVPKVPKPLSASDFRPINLLPLIDKVIETIVCRQLRNYFESNKLLYSGQSGFRSNHSCESALQYVCAVWRNEMARENVTVSVFVDLQRAFETIDRDILLKKLHNYGLRGSVLIWFENYLQSRFHKTKVNNRISEKIVSHWGVPQGSVLGPVLFIIYVNDLHLLLKRSFISLFADDTLICMSGRPSENIADLLNSELSILYDWLCQNKLKLNVSKTKCMVLGSTRNCQKFAEEGCNLYINGSLIKCVTEIKYLGVVLDPQLNFSKHIDFLSKKLGKKIGFFYRVSQYLSVYAKKLVYNSIIFPHFNYCFSLLISCTQDNINRLQILQNKAMRIVLGCNRYTSTYDMLQTLKWLNIRQLIAKANIVTIYKIEHNYYPDYLSDFLVRRCSSVPYNIRSGCDFNISFVKSTLLQKSLLYDGLRLYNSLPDKLREINNLGLFQKRIKRFLFDEQFWYHNFGV